MFLSDENKGFLWDIMSDNDKFKTEINRNVIAVKKSFEELLEDVNNNNKNKELLELNKIFLMEFNKFLDNNKVNEKITKQEISDGRISDFERRLKIRQNDFTDSMKNEIPNEIDFKDNQDEPLLNVEDELQKKIEQRKYDNVNVGDIEEGKKWLGIDSSFNPRSKIEEIHNLPDTKDNNNFQTREEKDIFSKLKKIDNDNFLPVSENYWLENFKRLERKLDIIVEYIENMQKTMK